MHGLLMEVKIMWRAYAYLIRRHCFECSGKMTS
jgi:hypothetical protein